VYFLTYINYYDYHNIMELITLNRHSSGARHCLLLNFLLMLRVVFAMWQTFAVRAGCWPSYYGAVQAAGQVTAGWGRLRAEL